MEISCSRRLITNTTASYTQHGGPRWLLCARAKQQRCRIQSTAAALRWSAAASTIDAMPSETASTSASSPQLRLQKTFHLPDNYKYQHVPCASPVEPGDLRCSHIEALFQHVLGYPRLPPRVHRYLKRSNVTVEAVTAMVEGLSDKYGKELVFYLLRRNPLMMERTWEELTERADMARAMLDLRPHEVFMLLRKNPFILIMDATEARARFNKLHRVTPLSHEAVKVMVRKYPVVLNRRAETIEAVIDKLRHLAYTRAMWQQDFDTMTPSLMAIFLKDHKDLLLRLEYLALTSQGATWTLRQVFKTSNNLFAKKHRGFQTWVNIRAARRQQLHQRAQQAKKAGLWRTTGQSSRVERQAAL